MSQRIANVNANFVNAEADPAQTGGLGGIEGIIPDVNPLNPSTIQLRVGADGPSGINKEQTFLPIAVTPTFTVT